MNPVTIPVLLKDGYKVGHKFQYPQDTTLIYSNFTPRSTRREEHAFFKERQQPFVVALGFQYFVQEYLIDQFNENFFELRKEKVLAVYKRRIDNYLGPGLPLDHIAALHDLQYLPLRIKAVPEGTLVPLRTPVLTIRNTVPEFFWLTNMLETLMSNVLWMPSTSATTAFRYREAFERWARVTGAAKEFVKWQGHDFSMRGMPGIEAACLSGFGHLTCFTGTDTIPAIDFAEYYYGADCEKELVGGSVPATEHSVMCVGKQAGEFETIKRLLTEVYPTGIVSIVCDTWDFWKVVTEYLPALKDIILQRPGKLVIRPDSGDPVKILCGDETSNIDHVRLGLIECLWNIFGGTVNEKGYKVLDEHIGDIYGDSITRERQEQILTRLAFKKFASSNVVLGIGSYTYQHVTRDTDGWAMKATYAETVSEGPQNIFKKPATDDGTKNSATGLLRVNADGSLSEKVTPLEEEEGILFPIFDNGKKENLTTLAAIRQRIDSHF